MQLRVPPERAGERLDLLLADHVGSRARAQRLIDEGHVTVDGEPRQKRFRAPRGALVTWEEPVRDAPRAEPVDIDVAVAYEDEYLLVVDKPAGLVVHPARGHRSGTLAQALAGRAAGGDADRPGIVHRLDRDTSGLLVVARSEEAHRRLKDLIGERLVLREYLALVLGRPPARSGTIDAPIGRDRRERMKNSTDTDAPREAVTHFELERALGETSLLRVRLKTGRTHQIRVHLQAIGHPVAGDPEYGGAGAFGLERQFLHAAHLAFTHPFTGDAVDVTSPLPDDLQLILGRLS